MAGAVLAIDPGIEGAVAVFTRPSPGADHLDAMALPTHGEDAKRRINAAVLCRWIMERAPSVGLIENVNAMPDQGIASAFRFGRAAGYLEATVICAGVPLELVAPVTWKKFYNLVGPDKEQSRQKAIMLFPYAAHLFARKKDHQIAEACLIAHYGWMVRHG